MGSFLADYDGAFQADSGRRRAECVHGGIFEFHVCIRCLPRPADVDDDGVAVRTTAAERAGSDVRVAGDRRDSDVPDLPVLPKHYHARHRGAIGKINIAKSLKPKA